MKTRDAKIQASLVPYHRLLSLRGQLDEIEAALRCSKQLSHPGRYRQLPPLALLALRKAIQAELEAAELQWKAQRAASRKRAA